MSGARLQCFGDIRNRPDAEQCDRFRGLSYGVDQGLDSIAVHRSRIVFQPVISCPAALPADLIIRPEPHSDRYVGTTGQFQQLGEQSAAVYGITEIAYHKFHVKLWGTKQHQQCPGIVYIVADVGIEYDGYPAPM